MRRFWILMLMLAVIAPGVLAQTQNNNRIRMDIHIKPQPAVQPATPEPLSLPVGTAVKMKLETIVSTIASNPGDSFSGRVTEEVKLNGQTVIPIGASLQGTVLHVAEPRRLHGLPTIHLRPETITMPDGKRFAITATVVDIDPTTKLNVSEEGQIRAPGMNRRDKLEIAGGTASGAMIGSTWGAQGAFVGTVIGASATVGHWLMKRKSAVIPAGTEIVMELSRPMALTPAEAGN